MTSGDKQDNASATAEPDFAKAFQELARGERAAAALENHLDSLERKIEDLLAKADADEKNLGTQAQSQSKPSSANPPSAEKEPRPS
ncbi:unnamed protein product [Periconia digitata]|uniref:Uncharacterized protein n=1 Tax=Periconia digitata TaxID=1303443 RepID=A0A9W4XZ83_9PLEO|nr:unnamed protein product [Periconia digitata]